MLTEGFKCITFSDLLVCLVIFWLVWKELLMLLSFQEKVSGIMDRTAVEGLAVMVRKETSMWPRRGSPGLGVFFQSPRVSVWGAEIGIHLCAGR